MTLDQLISIMPHAQSVASDYLEMFNTIPLEYDINTPRRMAHFLSQIAQESSELRYTKENLNYSASGLRRTFPKYFKTDAEAQSYARNPMAIANRVYANRLGNGDELSGDGWTFRGHGLIQLTGRSNYVGYRNHLISLYRKGVVGRVPDLSELPDLLSQPADAVRSACWFWWRNNINLLADNELNDTACKSVTRRVNGGTMGLDARRRYLDIALRVLGAR